MMNNLCCVLNKAFHSNWRGDIQYFCLECITKFLENEYGYFKRSDKETIARLIKDFKFLHSLDECSRLCPPI